MRPMKPEEFAKILCEKLEKVILDRESAEKTMREPGTPVSVSICEVNLTMVSFYLGEIIESCPNIQRDV